MTGRDLITNGREINHITLPFPHASNGRYESAMTGEKSDRDSGEQTAMWTGYTKHRDPHTPRPEAQIKIPSAFYRSTPTFANIQHISTSTRLLTGTFDKFRVAQATSRVIVYILPPMSIYLAWDFPPAPRSMAVIFWKFLSMIPPNNLPEPPKRNPNKRKSPTGKD